MIIEKYGIEWDNGSELEIERHMCREGGYMKRGWGLAGKGMLFHFIEYQKHLYGESKKWHRWNTKQTELFLTHRTMGIIGPASSGKTCSSATDLLADWWLFPECTTVLVCSTTKERMQDRIFGELKKYFKIARERYPELPGRAIDGRMRIVHEDADTLKDGRDFRNGMIGIPCLGSGDYKGLSEFIGIKNKRVRVVFDELQMLPPGVILTISNLDKNPDFKLIGLGNPKSTIDALGQLCEPAHHLGGWDGNIDQEPVTKHWETNRPDGVCLQLVGTDSPNLDGKLGADLITQEAIDRDVAQYGKDSLQFTMMNQGMMPRGQGSRRVLTQQLARKNRAMDEPIWMDSTRVKIASLDAAYGGAGGDRCIFTEIHFGPEMEELDPSKMITNLIMQDTRRKRRRFIIALIEHMLVPISVKDRAEAEEQIVTYVHQQCSTRGIPPENFFYDSGMRTGLVNAFARLWSTKTNPVDCGGNPSERNVSAQIQTPCNKYYSKFITEIWFNVRHAVEAGQFRGMTQQALDEFCAREWTMVAGNKIEIEPKRKMKEKIGRSPDIADAVALGVLGAIRKGFVIDNLISPHEKKDSVKWKGDLRNRARTVWAEGNLSYSK
jgi:hypothetical protein